MYGRRRFFTDGRGGKVQPVYRFPVQAKAIFKQAAEIRQFAIPQIAVYREFTNGFHYVNILFGKRDIDIETGIKIIPPQIGKRSHPFGYIAAVQVLPLVTSAESR